MDARNSLHCRAVQFLQIYDEAIHFEYVAWRHFLVFTECLSHSKLHSDLSIVASIISRFLEGFTEHREVFTLQWKSSYLSTVLTNWTVISLSYGLWFWLTVVYLKDLRRFCLWGVRALSDVTIVITATTFPRYVTTNDCGHCHQWLQCMSPTSVANVCQPTGLMSVTDVHHQCPNDCHQWLPSMTLSPMTVNVYHERLAALNFLWLYV